jgi:hypothetical protein
MITCAGMCESCTTGRQKVNIEPTDAISYLTVRYRMTSRLTHSNGIKARSCAVVVKQQASA